MKKCTKMLKLFIERSISSVTTIKIGSVQKKVPAPRILENEERKSFWRKNRSLIPARSRSDPKLSNVD